jgi:hypothetical protein
LEAIEERAPSETVRCRAITPSGEVCGAGLWRPIDGDLIEVSHSVRNGRRFTFILPLLAAQQTMIPCVRCGTHWWVADVRTPKQLPRELAAFAIRASRPREELIGMAAELQTAEAA